MSSWSRNDLIDRMPPSPVQVQADGRRLSRRLRHAVAALQSFGVERASKVGLGKRILIVNSLTLVGALLYATGLITDLLMPMSWMVALDVFALGSHLLLPFVNRAGYFLTSRIAFLLLANGVMTLAAAAEGPASGMQYLLITLAPVPLLLFTRASRMERGLMFAGVALSVACFFALDAVQLHGLVPAWLRLPTSRTIFIDSVLAAFVFSIAMVFYLMEAERRARRKLLEQQGKMLATAKLSALGEMASGVAHEINNPLGILALISARMSQLAQAERLNPSTALKLSGDIDNLVTRISKIVRNLRAFARDGSDDPVAKVPLASVIEGATSFCRERCRNQAIELRVLMPNEEMHVDCRAIELTQILVNLLNNAREAVERQTDLSTRWINVVVVDQEAAVEVRVSNGGPLVEEAHRTKIFEPFFSTKPVGQGTGMGLSVSLGIAQAHGGTLSLDASSPSTCFVLHLPASREV